MFIGADSPVFGSKSASLRILSVVSALGKNDAKALSALL